MWLVFLISVVMDELKFEFDELASDIRVARMLGLSYKLDYNQQTGVQSLAVAGKMMRYVKGKEVK